MKSNKNIYIPCIIGIILCLIISSIEGWVTVSNTNHWYEILNKPAFNPPAYIFGPVWTVLYIMIGIAGGLIWSKRDKHQKLFALFMLQLVFNFLWSFLFFFWQSIFWALIDITFLWITLLTIIVYSYQSYRTILYWLSPYFIWVSFATVLNFSLWMLN